MERSANSITESTAGRPGDFEQECAPRSGERTLYGRRIGRPLRQGRQQLLAELLPRLRVPVPREGSLDPAALFDPPVREVWLEIGAGNGSHAAWQAAQNPDVGVIAVEPFINGVAALLRVVAEQGLHNVRVLDDDARPLLDALAPNSIARAFIIHPDPWPKRRHWRRRIVCSEVLDALAIAMPAQSELRLATDDVGYLVWMLRVLRAHPGFDWAPACADDWRVRPADWPQTRFEEKGVEAGRPSTFLCLRRHSSDS